MAAPFLTVPSAVQQREPPSESAGFHGEKKCQNFTELAQSRAFLGRV